jgi:flagellar biosynthesis protein
VSVVARVLSRGEHHERAREAGVPVHKDPELADALAGLALGQEVPEDLWTAVAEARAWAYSVGDAAITPNR